ncbi:MAG: tryptophan synthase subunit alpha [Candidatus Margulisbacteria bacterium]|nr:tryptophan synthase subunit alpha [Candidatus Margulisiibacteriota bacterium]
MPSLVKIFQKHKALIAFITVGDPTLAQTEKLVLALEKAGADVIELGIPFSDPLADGPVIQAAHLRALKNNISLSQVFKLVAKLRKKTQIPLCFMLSYNLVIQYGEEQFYIDCGKYGVDGVIVPDLPAEETTVTSNQLPVNRILLVAPTSSDERIKLAAENSAGFVYLISTTGITGKRSQLSVELPGLVSCVKRFTSLPVAVGFGISTPAQAAEAAKYADGVIVGSAIVDLIGKKKYGAAVKLVAAMRKAIDKGAS